MKKSIQTLLAASLFSFGLVGIASAGPVNINKASADQIADSLNGVGIKKAREIVAFRDKNGPFKSVEQLEDVKGIGAKMVEKNRANIRLGDTAPAAAKAQ